MLVSIKIVNEIFYKVFLMLSLYNTACNVRVHHDSDTQFLLEILDLYLDFIELKVGKVDLPTHWLLTYQRALGY